MTKLYYKLGALPSFETLKFDLLMTLSRILAHILLPKLQA